MRYADLNHFLLPDFKGRDIPQSISFTAIEFQENPYVNFKPILCVNLNRIQLNSIESQFSDRKIKYLKRNLPMIKMTSHLHIL